MSVTLSTKKEEFKQLPRPFKQLQYAKPEVLRPAPALKELPRILVPSNDRRIPLPPLVNYGYALTMERMQELCEQKLDCPRRLFDTNTFGIIVHLQSEVFQYGIRLRGAYCDGAEMLFISISSNLEPSRSARLDEVVQKLKDFLEVDEEPVWCLDVEQCYWRK